MKHHDLIVLGTGSGNSVIDHSMADCGARELTVTDELGNRSQLSADRMVVAAGGRPVVPSVGADSGLPYETSDTIMRIDAPPRRLAVLGVGYIAAELAHVFAAAGSEITIVEKAEMLLGGPQDDEVRRTPNGDRLKVAATPIHVCVMAIEFGIPATDLARRPHWIHPALTEVMQNALLDVSAAA